MLCELGLFIKLLGHFGSSLLSTLFAHPPSHIKTETTICSFRIRHHAPTPTFFPR